MIVPGSGAFGRPGDVELESFLIEAKTTLLREFRLKLGVIEKLTAEADSAMRSPMLAIAFESAPAGIEQDWVLIPARIFAALIAGGREASVR